MRKSVLLPTALSGGGEASFVGAYDAIPNLVHVYEIARRTLSAYTGNLVRLRRSSDNAEADFGYVEATGELDTSAIATWLGAGTGYIVTVYDQKGTDNLTMATAVRQPTYSATAKNGHAGGVWDGSAVYQQSDALQCAFTNGGLISQPYSVYAVAQLDASKINNGAFVLLLDGDNGTNRPYVGQIPTATPDAWGMNGGGDVLDSASSNTFNLWSILFSGANSRFYLNNVSVASGNAGTAKVDGITLGSNFALEDAAAWKGPITNLIVATSHSDDNRIAMQEAVNTYWDMYDPFELPAGEPDYSIVHIPDTQIYTGYVADPPVEMFQAMTQWIADNMVSTKIGLVLHSGDVVIPSDETTWGFANSALDTIDALNLPVLYSTGNHDYDGPASGNLSSERLSTVWNTYLPQSHYTGKGWWSGGFYEAGKSENAYLLVTLGGVDYVILSLEFGPRQAIVDWANTILTTYAARDAIILTHCYMYHDTSRVGTGDDWNPHSIIEGSTDTHDGDELWTELVKLHSNIVQVLCGHDRGINYLVSSGDGGNIVTQFLNAHDFETGQMLIVRYYLSQNKVAYTRYSPVTNKVDYQVVLDYKAT